MDRALSDALVAHFCWEHLADFIEKGVCHPGL
jgi:hypothetical protein